MAPGMNTEDMKEFLSVSPDYMLIHEQLNDGYETYRNFFPYALRYSRANLEAIKRGLLDFLAGKDVNFSVSYFGQNYVVDRDDLEYMVNLMVRLELIEDPARMHEEYDPLVDRVYDIWSPLVYTELLAEMLISNLAEIIEDFEGYVGFTPHYLLYLFPINLEARHALMFHFYSGDSLLRAYSPRFPDESNELVKLVRALDRIALMRIIDEVYMLMFVQSNGREEAAKRALGSELLPTDVILLNMILDMLFMSIHNNFWSVAGGIRKHLEVVRSAKKEFLTLTDDEILEKPDYYGFRPHHMFTYINSHVLEFIYAGFHSAFEPIYMKYYGLKAYNAMVAKGYRWYRFLAPRTFSSGSYTLGIMNRYSMAPEWYSKIGFSGLSAEYGLKAAFGLKHGDNAFSRMFNSTMGLKLYLDMYSSVNFDSSILEDYPYTEPGYDMRVLMTGVRNVSFLSYWVAATGVYSSVAEEAVPGDAREVPGTADHYVYQRLKPFLLTEEEMPNRVNLSNYVYFSIRPHIYNHLAPEQYSGENLPEAPAVKKLRDAFPRKDIFDIMVSEGLIGYPYAYFEPPETYGVRDTDELRIILETSMSYQVPYYYHHFKRPYPQYLAIDETPMLVPLAKALIGGWEFVLSNRDGEEAERELNYIVGEDYMERYRKLKEAVELLNGVDQDFEGAVHKFLWSMEVIKFPGGFAYMWESPGPAASTNDIISRKKSLVKDPVFRPWEITFDGSHENERSMALFQELYNLKEPDRAVVAGWIMSYAKLMKDPEFYRKLYQSEYVVP